MATDLSTTTKPIDATPKTLDDIIAEQGVRPLERFESLFGAGRDLWTDQEFDNFLERVKSSRLEKE